MLTILGHKHRFCDGLSRRNFLRIGGLALGGLSLPDMLRAESAAGAAIAQSDHHDLPAGRAAASGLVRSEDGRARRNPRRIPADQHQRAGHRNLRALSATGNDDGQLAVDPLDRRRQPQHDAFQCLTGRRRERQQPPGGWPAWAR